MNALGREEYIRIGIVTDECWITSGGRDIVEVMRGIDRKMLRIITPPLGNVRLCSYVQQYPCLCLKRVMNELLELVYTCEETPPGVSFCTLNMHTVRTIRHMSCN